MSINKLIIFLFFFINAYSLELSRVILASDDNPIYLEFWPVIAPIWSSMGFQPTLALIGDASVDASLGDVIHFDKIPGVSSALQAQVIRLFVPFLFPEEGCLISDIDMIPISESYFRIPALQCPGEAFLVYHDKAEGCEGERFPMCYLAAKGKTFSSICDIKNYSDIANRIYEWASYDLGWNTDELVFYSKALHWEAQGGHLLRLGRSIGPRLDRGNWNFDLKSLDVSYYIDCHCPRPYSHYKNSIDQIVDKIYETLYPSQ